MSKIKAWFDRHATTIGAIVIFLVLGGIVLIQTVALGRLEEEISNQQTVIAQTKMLADSLDSHAADRTQQIDELNRHLDCIVLFFSQPDRSSKSISDIDTCTVEAENGAVSPLSGMGSYDTNTGTTTTPSTSSSTSSSSSSTSSTSTGSTTTTPPANTTPAPQPSFLDTYLINPVTNLVKNIL